jgi:hypothetical protein
MSVWSPKRVLELMYAMDKQREQINNAGTCHAHS